MLKKFRYGFEAFFLIIGLILFRLMPLDVASAVGGWLGRVIGPFVRAHRTAENNLIRVMPELNESQRRKILRDMWDNLGRVMGEYPHLTRNIMRRRITVEGLEHLRAVRESGKGAVFISGHFANWEIIPLTSAIHGVPLALVYRAPNNPVTEKILRFIRAAYNRELFNKGHGGAIQSLRTLKEGQTLGMMIDQKFNNGKNVPFFGFDAMTTLAPTTMAIKYQIPVMIANAVRTDGAHFHVTLLPPKYYAPDADPVQSMLDIHAIFEGWIRAHPAQWFWVHNRWDWAKIATGL